MVEQQIVRAMDRTCTQPGKCASHLAPFALQLDVRRTVLKSDRQTSVAGCEYSSVVGICPRHIVLGLIGSAEGSTSHAVCLATLSLSSVCFNVKHLYNWLVGHCVLTTIDVRPDYISSHNTKSSRIYYC